MVDGTQQDLSPDRQKCHKRTKTKKLLVFHLRRKTRKLNVCPRVLAISLFLVAPVPGKQQGLSACSHGWMDGWMDEVLAASKREGI